MIRPDLIKRIHPVASGEFLENKGASESLSSFQPRGPAGEERLNKRKFFFEVWAELLFMGRTEPDATRVA